MSLPPPYVWHVFGSVRPPDGLPFCQGKIKTPDGHIGTSLRPVM